MNKNDLTSKYTVFAFLYAVLAPKTNKKVVLKKMFQGPINAVFVLSNTQIYIIF